MPALPTKNHDARKRPVGSKLSCCILYVKSNNIFQSEERISLDQKFEDFKWY